MKMLKTVILAATVLLSVNLASASNISAFASAFPGDDNFDHQWSYSTGPGTVSWYAVVFVEGSAKVQLWSLSFATLDFEKSIVGDGSDSGSFAYDGAAEVVAEAAISSDAQPAAYAEASIDYTW